MVRWNLDVTRAEELVLAIHEGETRAWKPLMALLCPEILDFVRRSRSLGFRRCDEDTGHEVLTTVLERLRKHDFRALKTYVTWKEAERNRRKTFADWLHIVTDRVACDFVTHCARRSVRWTDFEPGAGGEIASTEMMNVQVARELVEYADRVFPPEQSDVVRQVYEGRSTEEIARERKEERQVVDRRLRAAYARLRRWVDAPVAIVARQATSTCQ